MSRGGPAAPRYPAPIQRPHAPVPPLYRAPPAPSPARQHHAPQRNNLYYQHQQRNGAGGGGNGGGERAPEGGEVTPGAEEQVEAGAPECPPAADLKAD
ncbi:hypothetical protein RR48_11756 [Papilio machaon]|uniref:Uncharacterized protein n=1 Tax=Papilio machaon TaxID=76193 RepID=A0A194QMY1_PAPMA|nr:hypothetical protein RR48_11756 [Papilio machaon]